MQGAPDATALVGYGAVFTLFFITLGPLKILGPFVQLTRETDEATMRRIALRALTVMVLQIIGAVLGVLQVALAVEMILRALQELGVPLG